MGGAGGAGTCVEGAASCADGFTPSRCNAAGTWEAQPRCAGIQICTNGACTGLCPLSRPNDCIDITHARTCVDGSLVPWTCTIGYICSLGQCVPNMT